MMEIFHISAECYPIAKVGGLADVVGALPFYQNDMGVKANVIMPFYDTKFVRNNKLKTLARQKIWLGNDELNCKILVPVKSTIKFNLFLIWIEGLTDRENVYGYQDDVERFTAFQIAALDWITKLKDKPNIIHCHDHHTGLVPFMMLYCQKYSDIRSIPTVLSIHNAQYQGDFSFDKLHYLPLFNHIHNGLLDWDGRINPLACAIKCAWRVTTVSPSYLKELMFHANGLEKLLEHEKAKTLGILNGVDYNVWNPDTDSMIAKKYSAKTVISGKKASKAALCKQFKLDPKKPLFAFIGRLVWEKGADLFPEIFQQMLASSKNNSNFLVLGSGNTDTEKQLSGLKERFSGSYNVYIGYDEPLSHLIYAGADFLLMPSRVEPCGLNQMYSLRYGTIPIVNNIGGLKDTIVDVKKKDGFGIKHSEANKSEIVKAILRAQNLYANKDKFRRIQKRIMSIDHSWHSSVKQYINLYKQLIDLK